MVKRLAVIGDVGGYAGVFADQLRGLDIDAETGSMPDGLVVVQVGDLVHRGPDSAQVVQMVDRIMAANPERWVQLCGNHESQYLPGGTDFWAPPVDDQTQRTLLRWWRDGQLRVAVAFDVADPATGRIDVGSDPANGTGSDDTSGAGRSGAVSMLLTHAGLTAGAWKLFGRPSTTGEMADLLNAAEHPVVWREGERITGVPDLAAGPLWASAAELYESWAEPLADAPQLLQVHGHTCLIDAEPVVLDPRLRSVLHNHAEVAVDLPSRTVQVRVDVEGAPPLTQRSFYAIDPGHFGEPAVIERTLTFDLA